MDTQHDRRPGQRQGSSARIRSRTAAPLTLLAALVASVALVALGEPVSTEEPRVTHPFTSKEASP